MSPSRITMLNILHYFLLLGHEEKHLCPAAYGFRFNAMTGGPRGVEGVYVCSQSTRQGKTGLTSF